ncbi:thioredoxin family protein [Spirochaetia bacterium 38H-sp]|uniref:Thioredoxin family protein n=1 Tax=Rarispira pelagica TaxID=3141764 RepID=A0ABU9UCU0_9SPIR
MKIQFLYFEGCPNSKETRKNLDKALSELGIITDVEDILVSSPEEAEKYRFMGSPSILLDKKDIETGKEPGEVGFTCRIYRIGEKATGILPVEYIKKRILELS